MRRICRWILDLWGFEFEGEFPHHIAKKVIIVAPHSSNWDFVIGLLYKIGHNVKTNYLAKKSLFKKPWGWFFRWLGGVPVDRTQKHSLVDHIVNIFNSKEEFTLVIAPEGTRAKVAKFKTGFYHIAKEAKVPLVMIKFDVRNRKFVIADPYHLSNDQTHDINFIENYYRGTIGVNPDNSFI